MTDVAAKMAFLEAMSTIGRFANGEIVEAAGNPVPIHGFPKDFGGGGGSRTRVREYAVAELYMRSRSWFFAPHVKERRKPSGASPDAVLPPPVGTASGGQPAFMTSRSHPAGKDEVDVADLRFS